MSKCLLEINQVSKSYLFNKVLDNISLKLLPGMFYTLIGENGAGKSTIFKIIVGLEHPNQGNGLLLGENLTAVSAKNKHRIGIVSEQIELDGPLCMKDFYRFYQSYFPKWDHQLFDHIISHQGIDLSKQFKKYSRGEKMQLVLIAELCKSPDILLIDEITSVLDVYGRQFYLNLFKEYTQKKNGTIFLTTNIITEVSLFLDHVFVLKDGLMAFNGNTKDISKLIVKIDKKNFSHQYKNYLELPDYFLVDRKEINQADTTKLYPASTEDLFLYIYRIKDRKVYHDKAS